MNLLKHTAAFKMEQFMRSVEAEITSLRAENERMRAENERMRAENERMRKALTKIALHYDRIYYPGELSFEFAEIARAALKGDSNE